MQAPTTINRIDFNEALAAARGFAWTPPNQDQADDSYEVIADALEANLALDRFVFQLD